MFVFPVGDYRKTKILNLCFSLVTCRVFHLGIFSFIKKKNNKKKPYTGTMKD